MGLWEAVRTCYFKKYFVFADRAGRPEFLWFFLYSALMGQALALALAGVPYLVILVNIFGFLIPQLSVSARRLHDTNKSNWYLLLLAPYLTVLVLPAAPPIMLPVEWVDIFDLGLLAATFGGVIALFVLCCLKGTAGPNRYGPALVPREK